MNLLLDVGFNREVAEDAALYWTKEPGDLAALIARADALPEEEVARLDTASTRRIEIAYSWRHITDLYETLFLTVGGEA